MSDSRQRVLSAKLPPELIAALGEEAQRLGITRNAVVRRALEECVGGGHPVAEQERRMARAVARMAEEHALARRLEEQGVLRTGWAK